MWSTNRWACWHILTSCWASDQAGLDPVKYQFLYEYSALIPGRWGCQICSNFLFCLIRHHFRRENCPWGYILLHFCNFCFLFFLHSTFQSEEHFVLYVWFSFSFFCFVLVNLFSLWVSWIEFFSDFSFFLRLTTGTEFDLLRNRRQKSVSHWSVYSLLVYQFTQLN